MTKRLPRAADPAAGNCAAERTVTEKVEGGEVRVHWTDFGDRSRFSVIKVRPIEAERRDGE